MHWQDWSTGWVRWTDSRWDTGKDRQWHHIQVGPSALVQHPWKTELHKIKGTACVELLPMQNSHRNRSHLKQEPSASSVPENPLMSHLCWSLCIWYRCYSWLYWTLQTMRRCIMSCHLPKNSQCCLPSTLHTACKFISACTFYYFAHLSWAPLMQNHLPAQEGAPEEESRAQPCHPSARVPVLPSTKCSWAAL